MDQRTRLRYCCFRSSEPFLTFLRTLSTHYIAASHSLPKEQMKSRFSTEYLDQTMSHTLPSGKQNYDFSTAI